MAGAVGAALTASACASATSAAISPRVQLRTSIEMALDEHRLDAALADASVYERRVPGPESWTLLGRTLWRAGDLTAAEGFFRRAAAAGGPGGVLGLAESAAARGRLDRAVELALQARQAPEVSASASRLLAAIAWRRGALQEAGDHLRDAALGANDDERAGLLTVAAVVDRMRRERPEAATGPLEWTGSAARLSLGNSGPLSVEARVGGRSARLTVALDATQSSLTPEFAARAGLPQEGGGSIGGWAIGSLQIGSLSARAIPFALAAAPAGDGVLGFDVLSTLGWTLWPASRTWAVDAPTAGRARDAQPSFQGTHWASVRTPVDLLGQQLLVLPRVGSAVLTAALDLSGPERISAVGLTRATTHGPELDDPQSGDGVSLRVRIGGWASPAEFRLQELDLPEAGRPVAPQATLGARLGSRWGFRWRPGDRQLALILAGS